MTSNELSPLKPKQKRRLYEPIILYKALAEITQEEGALRQTEVINNSETEEQKYHRFLHSIASVCDRVKRGKTVTSVTILDEEDNFTYVFGCNQVFDKDLHDTRDFLSSLLKKLSGFSSLSSAEQTSVRNEILKMILAFNSPRIKCYLDTLKKNIEQCLEYCQRSATENDTEVGRGLATLSIAIEHTTFGAMTDAQYISSFSSVLKALKSFLTSRTTSYIENNAKTGRIRDGRSFECWSELRHAISRLQSYKKTVQCLIDSEGAWPELFQEFDVVPIQSTKPDSNPLGKKSEAAHGIIGRMCSDGASIERYRGLARSLEWISLDDRIMTQCTRSSFKPYVHSEVLVLEWVMARPNAAFFHDWKYIGSSKGACQLCRYYFDAAGQHNDIKTRPSHGNLYVNWRFPDIREPEKPSCKTRRQTIYNSMMARIREDAFSILVDKSSKGKRHDSSTHPLTSVLYASTDIWTDTGAREIPDIDELGEQFSKGLTLKSVIETIEESDADNEDGGTSLG
ncbi:hypothetical protein FLAG1_02742 [Fusarium langsethiae]|uniref:Uncharacterized protein n=1 Tax=Fusarium langsethiae TaxID=179993 RepID=A0A0N0DGP3_FUSLA|nr:hypothetical protein FLAG1_02742 [Fusarium langsethiae]GKU00491.1 unnamed protein product [Fusarium langsethiae]GKU19311.1 unnamed protein product [Fusarium langsethiae]